MGNESKGEDEQAAHPAINLSPALGEAGHEVEELGFDDVPDTGPVTKHDEKARPDAQHEIARDIVVE